MSLLPHLNSLLSWRRNYLFQSSLSSGKIHLDRIDRLASSSPVTSVFLSSFSLHCYSPRFRYSSTRGVNESRGMGLQTVPNTTFSSVFENFKFQTPRTPSFRTDHSWTEGSPRHCPLRVHGERCWGFRCVIVKVKCLSFWFRVEPSHCGLREDPGRSKERWEGYSVNRYV